MTGRRVSRSATFHTAESDRAVIRSFQLARISRSSVMSSRPLTTARSLASANRSTIGAIVSNWWEVCHFPNRVVGIFMSTSVRRIETGPIQTRPHTASPAIRTHVAPARACTRRTGLPWK